MKIQKNHLKELIRNSIIEKLSEMDIETDPFDKEDVKESKQRRFTVKEVRMWMKKLEENRYKKVYNSDARRVSWMVNNEGVELSEMPKSMSKKWTKAQYGRERYLANEFIKSKSEQMTEGKLAEAIKKVPDAEDGSGYRQDWIGIYKGKFIQFKANFPVDAKKHTINYFKVSKSTYSEVVVISKKEYDIQQKLKVEGKLTSEQKLRKVIREILKEQMNEKLNLGGAYEKMILKHNDKIAQGALSLVRQKIMKDYKLGQVRKGTKVTRRLVATHINNGMKELRNKAKSPGLKKAFEKIINTREAMLKTMKEGKLTEGFKKVILPNDMKTKKVVSKMIKQLKLKIDKDYDVKALKARGGDQVISILPKHYNKFIELAVQNKINPRG